PGPLPRRTCAASGLLETPRVAGEERRRRERVQPPVVLGADEVQRAAVQPADHERPLVGQRVVEAGERRPGRPCAYRKAGAAEILRLDGEQPPGDRDAVCRLVGAEELSLEPRGEALVHLCIFAAAGNKAAAPESLCLTATRLEGATHALAQDSPPTRGGRRHCVGSDLGRRRRREREALPQSQ